LQAKISHRPPHGAACSIEALALHLPLHFAQTVNAEVLGKDPQNLELQLFILPDASGLQSRVSPLGKALVIGGWGDRPKPADRLDRIGIAMLVDEGNHRLNGRSSAAWAKYADALRRISLACRSLRTSRSNASSFSAVSVGTPPRFPLSTSDFFTHSNSVCPEHPIFSATDVTAAQGEG